MSLLLLYPLFAQELPQEVNSDRLIRQLEAQIAQYPDSLGLYEMYFKETLSKCGFSDSLFAWLGKTEVRFNQLLQASHDTVAVCDLQIKMLRRYDSFLSIAYQQKLNNLNKDRKEMQMDSLNREYEQQRDLIREKFTSLCLKLAGKNVNPGLKYFCRSLLLDQRQQGLIDRSKMEPAPSFTCPLLSGDTISLGDLKGNYILLHFWSMYSLPSIKNLSELCQIQKQHVKHGLVIISINVDKMDSKLRREVLKNFITEMDLNWYHIADGEEKKISDLYFAKNYPMYFLIDPQSYLIGQYYSSKEADLVSHLSSIYLKH